MRTRMPDEVRDLAVRAWLPEGQQGVAEISHVEVSEDTAKFDRLRAAINGTGRHVTPGVWTQLHVRRELVMSDTRDEQRDHMEPIRQAWWTSAERVLVNGLGLGMVAAGLAGLPCVREIDIVEVEQDVVDLVLPHLLARVDGAAEIRVHVADAYEIPWPRGTAWDVAWHDVWATISSRNVEGMQRLRRRYGRRVVWQGCWADIEVRRLIRHRGRGW